MNMFSIIIPVKDRWETLYNCIKSIDSAEKHNISIEIIIINDGSSTAIPDNILEFQKSLNIIFIDQIPLGISASRNNGILRANGKYLFFIDSDCIVDKKCFSGIIKTILSNSEEMAFTPELHGNQLNTVGKMEHARLRSTQDTLTDKKSYIRYINTSGFIINRKYMIEKVKLFDLAAVRGEDSLILFEMLKDKKLPMIIKGAKVYHHPVHGLFKYIKNHFWIGYYNYYSRKKLKTLKTLMNNKHRGSLLSNIKSFKIKFLIILAYLFEKTGRITSCVFSLRNGKTVLFSTVVDVLRENELLSKIFQAAVLRKGMIITYMTAWTLVQCEKDKKFKNLLEKSEICYIDGMGVLLALLFTRFKRSKKVTANHFYMDFFRECANRDIKLALVGSAPGTTDAIKEKFKKEIPGLNIVLCSSGFFAGKEDELIKKLKKSKPQVIIIGMSQPIQEKWAEKIKKEFPGTVLYCVGALFDLISGKDPSPKSWVRSTGLEWFWRLIHSPKRLWKRYVLGLPLLFLYMLKYLFYRNKKNVKKGR